MSTERDVEIEYALAATRWEEALKQDVLKLSSEVARLTAELEQARDMCARPEGVCFDPAVFTDD